MPFLFTRDLPPPDAYGARLQQAFPGGAVGAAGSIHGPGYSISVSISGVGVSVLLTHEQAARKAVAHTRVVATVPTRGLDIELSRADSLPSTMLARPLPTPALALLARLSAPEAVAERVLGGDVLPALAQHRDAHGHPGELCVGEGRVELSFGGWPAEPATVHAIAWIVGHVAASVPSAIDAVAGFGGTLDAHPEVVSLRARRAARMRVGRALLGAVAVGVVSTTLLVILIVLLVRR